MERTKLFSSLVNTFIGDGQEVLILKPSYAMYRFYSQLAGANVRKSTTRPNSGFSIGRVTGTNHAGNTRHLYQQSEQSDRNGNNVASLEKVLDARQMLPCWWMRLITNFAALPCCRCFGNGRTCL